MSKHYSDPSRADDPHALPKGTRVALHPACDEWMQGDRSGVVVGFGRARDYRDRFTGQVNRVKPIRVKLDRSGRIRRFHPENVSALADAREGVES